MMSTIRKNRSLRPDLLLFTKWYRFSRDTGKAYIEIGQLKAMGIQPQAVDQELDITIPENKILLAVYLAASEAENERRSLNVKQGIHKAKEEGRWIAHLPLGYKYELVDNNQRKMLPNEPEAMLIRKAFELIAENKRTAKSIYDQSVNAGLKCSKSNFWRIIRSPIYYGMFVVPAFEKEPARLVKGRHIPIISESLFNKTQEVLGHRRKNQPIYHGVKDDLFLRGFLYCPVCQSKLTGSASKANRQHYFYYHCGSTCGFRVRADKINYLFQHKLCELQMPDSYTNLYRDILKSLRKDLFTEFTTTGNTMITHIDRLITRIHKAKDLFMMNEIESEDYEVIKRDCERAIETLGTQLEQSAHAKTKRLNNQENIVSE